MEGGEQCIKGEVTGLCVEIEAWREEPGARRPRKEEMITSGFSAFKSQQLI